jgi:hypothetical protein
MRKTKVKTASLPGGWTLPFIFVALAMALALLAIPHLGHAQGIVRGAQQGAYEGNRVAGRSRACSACPNRAGTAAATATAMATFTAIGTIDALARVSF